MALLDFFAATETCSQTAFKSATTKLGVYLPFASLDDSQIDVSFVPIFILIALEPALRRHRKIGGAIQRAFRDEDEYFTFAAARLDNARFDDLHILAEMSALIALFSPYLVSYSVSIDVPHPL